MASAQSSTQNLCPERPALLAGTSCLNCSLLLHSAFCTPSTVAQPTCCARFMRDVVIVTWASLPAVGAPRHFHMLRVCSCYDRKTLSVWHAEMPCIRCKACHRCAWAGDAPAASLLPLTPAFLCCAVTELSIVVLQGCQPDDAADSFRYCRPGASCQVSARRGANHF